MTPGSRVRIKADPGRVGVTTGKKRERARRIYWQVTFPEGADFILESQLEMIPEDLEDPIVLLEQGKFGRARDLRGNLTYIRLNGRLANLIYSMETTNTDFFAYQFKPVVNFLESPSDGILIADEVGLGKTIEAGLIWTELRSRLDARRLLVLCPAMLREKWRDELLIRFGIDAEITGAAEIQRRFSEFRQGQRFEYALIGSMQGLRPLRGWDAEPPRSGASSALARFLRDNADEEPLVDLLIVDEAHYMRNPEAMTASLGRLLRDVAAHVVLLSATPIHLRNRDLYQLLNLVDEDTFNQPQVFDFILEANEPLVAARDAVLRGSVDAKEVIGLLNDAKLHPLLTSNRQLTGLLDDILLTREFDDRGVRSELASKLEKINLLGRVVTRTRKREVDEWRVLREAVADEVTPTDMERQFYDNVTDLVREYCKRHEAHEGFLLVMPQRQMSSSMPAALRDWQNRGSVDAETAYQDLGNHEVKSTEPLGPLVEELVRRAHELGDYRDLRARDTKYANLRRKLKRYLTESPKEKIVLFAYFRPTLHYLAERLTAEGIDCVTLTGGAGLDKQAIINRFREPTGPNVLLSSEVASEGVDLQFARVVVNYDLPWNPMKVEQRIGRIDRLGQRSPKVTIWNLFYADTIDSRIYNRLYQRLGIFERALGGLEAILGEKIRSLTMALLRGTLSPQDEEDRIEQTAMALAVYRLQEEELEHEAGNLIAHGDYILNQVRAARELSRWITGEDLWIYVRDFFSREYPGCDFRQIGADDLVFDVKLSTEARFDFERFLRSQRLLHQTTLARGRPKGVRCAFRNRPRRGGPRTNEYVTQFHPLVRFVSQQLRQSDEGYYPTVSVVVAREVLGNLSPGIYVFTVDRWSLQGLRDIERLSFLAKPLNGTSAFLPDDTAEQLTTAAARSGRDWPAAANAVDLSHAAFIVEQCLEESQLRYEHYVREIDFENNDRADVREQSLKRHWDRQRGRREQTLARHRLLGRERLIPAVEGQIAKLNQTMSQRLAEIERQRKLKHHKQEVCMGLIRVV